MRIRSGNNRSVVSLLFYGMVSSAESEEADFFRTVASCVIARVSCVRNLKIQDKNGKLRVLCNSALNETT